jgi:hypothetical protein
VRLQLNLVSAVALCAIFSWLIFERGRFAVRELQIMFAREQTALFEEMTRKALATKDEKELSEIRQYIEWYYPSGTKQAKGSSLDMIVESARRDALAAIDARVEACSSGKTATPGSARP